MKPKEMKPALDPQQITAVTFHEALLSAQSEMRNPELDSVNPHFRNKYASLTAFLHAVRPALHKHGILFAQDLTTTETGVSCTTILTFVTGEEVRYGPFNVPAARMDAQGIGSAASYAKRYTIGSVFGLVGEVDDDGNEATGNRNAAPAVAAKPLFKKAPAPNESEKAADALGLLMAKDKVHADLVRGFLESKNSWPKDCARISNLPVNILTRLVVPDVWTEVKNFVLPPTELNP